MRDTGSKSIGIREIAAAAGISIGTVDRALHNRAGVNPKTRNQVLKIAEKLGYKPNIAARTLKLNRRLRIAAHLPRQIASFFDPLRDGIREAAAALHSVTVDLSIRTYPHLGEGDIKLLEEDLEKDFDGILITPGNPNPLEPVIRRFTERGTAVVCVASDAPRSSRLASISADAAISGSIAAELLGTVLHCEGPVAIITGDLNTFDHGEKLRGFAATLATMAPHLTLLPAIESHESPREAYRADARTPAAQEQADRHLYQYRQQRPRFTRHRGKRNVGTGTADHYRPFQRTRSSDRVWQNPGHALPAALYARQACLRNAVPVPCRGYSAGTDHAVGASHHFAQQSPALP